MSRHAKKKQNNLAVEKVVEGAAEITTNVKKTSAKKHWSEKNKLRKQPHVCYIFSLLYSTQSSRAVFIHIFCINIYCNTFLSFKPHSIALPSTDFDNVNFSPEVPLGRGSALKE